MALSDLSLGHLKPHRFYPQPSSFAKRFCERDGSIEEVPSELPRDDWFPMRPLSPSWPFREEGARTPKKDVHDVRQTPAPPFADGFFGYAFDSDCEADNILRPDARVSVLASPYPLLCFKSSLSFRSFTLRCLH